MHLSFAIVILLKYLVPSNRAGIIPQGPFILVLPTHQPEHVAEPRDTSDVYVGEAAPGPFIRPPPTGAWPRPLATPSAEGARRLSQLTADDGGGRLAGRWIG